MKRRILSLLLVLTLLMALPFAVAAEENGTANQENVSITVSPEPDLTTGVIDVEVLDTLTFQLKDTGGNEVNSGFLRVPYGNSTTDMSVTNGAVQLPVSNLIVSNNDRLDGGSREYCFKYMESSDRDPIAEITLNISVHSVSVSNISLTSNYALGGQIDAFNVVFPQVNGVTFGTPQIRNEADEPVTSGTFDHQTYKVQVPVSFSKGYKPADDFAITLDGKPGEPIDGGYAFELYPTYTITYNNLDGRNLSNAPASYNKYSGTVTIPNPTKDGYRFLGWTGEGITEPQKDVSFAAKEMNRNLTYTAKWEKIIYHNVDFVTRHGATPQPQQVESGTKAARPADPTEDGWKFKGWYISDDYIGEPFDFTTAITENTTLYAKWAKTWTVTFDVNGHGTAPDPQTVDIGTKAVRPTDPAQTGWRFDGWYTDKDCTAAYDFDSVVTDNITLYAKWVKTVTVTYHVGSYGTAPDSQTVDAGKKFTRPADPVDSRAIFQGWYTDENYTTAYDFGSAVETDLNLYAKWKDGYRVVFQTAHGTAPAEQKVALDGKATKPADPTATGYIFKGWYTSQLYTAEFDFNTPITADTTLYAKWNEIYTVTFNVGGHGAAPTAQTVENGGKATKPENPTAKGWRFDGWYTDEKCTARYDFDKAVTANTTLYAKWTQLFTLTFETNGGTKIDSVEAPDGSLVYLGSYKPTKSGYYFVGWYTDKNLTRASRVGYVRMDGNKTVYAKFAVADKTNPKTADPALPGLALAVLSFSTVGLAAMGLKKRK